VPPAASGTALMRRKAKRSKPIVHLSLGPLPAKIADQFADRLLVFSDASLKRQAAGVAVFFADPAAEPQVATRIFATMGSNELELRAALFALAQAAQLYPAAEPALFCDNQDAVLRLQRAKILGLAQDSALAAMLPELDLAAALARATVHWVKGHGACRGNALADHYAALAAD